MFLKTLIFVFFNSIAFINCAIVKVTTDGSGVLNIPLTFTSQVMGEVAIDVKEFVYVFEDTALSPRRQQEVIGGREVNYTITYESSKVMSGSYTMKVQVFVYIWGFRGWIIAETDFQFKVGDSFDGNIIISQSDVSKKALKNSMVAINRTVELSADIRGHSLFLKNASISYAWFVDKLQFPPSPSPIFNYTFTSKKSYIIVAIIVCNTTLMGKNITIFSEFSRNLTAKYDIKDMNVKGNTWLLDGALLELQVNCSGGDSPFWYCYEFSRIKPRVNYTCSKELTFLNKCLFPITHYFPKNGTYYISIAVYNDLNFKNKTILVNVYDIVRQTQLSFVIIPLVSSILAIIIVVVGIAYHLQQRQRQQLTLEVADFDFQTNENLMEKTFFERLRDSMAMALRDTFFFPCHPCTRAYEDLIDDSDTLPVCDTTERTGINYSTNGLIKH